MYPDKGVAEKRFAFGKTFGARGNRLFFDLRVRFFHFVFLGWFPFVILFFGLFTGLFRSFLWIKEESLLPGLGL